MTREDADADAVETANGTAETAKVSGETANVSGEEQAATGPAATTEERPGRPLAAGAIGLLAGIVGGVAATTVAPGNLFATILLVIVVVLVVTLGTLRVLTR